MKKKPILCLMYDFDKTLCTEDMQNYKFIPDVGMTKDEFWGATGVFGKKTGTERILSYMYMMAKTAKEKGIEYSREYLNSLGKTIVYQKGLKTWFDRINKFGEENGIKVEHYVISSGLKEIIEGTSIYKEFKDVYACEYMFDDAGKNVLWPKQTINYTQKTQYIFRISKGVMKINDDNKVNERMPHSERRVHYQDMIYLGDGITDIPCMQIVKDMGGLSIAIYGEEYKDNALKLKGENRVNYFCEANYGVKSELEQIVKLRIEEIAIRHKLSDCRKKQEKIMKENNNV